MIRCLPLGPAAAFPPLPAPLLFSASLASFQLREPPLQLFDLVRLGRIVRALASQSSDVQKKSDEINEVMNRSRDVLNKSGEVLNQSSGVLGESLDALNGPLMPCINRVLPGQIQFCLDGTCLFVLRMM